ncbi:glutamate synthase large subunit [Alkalihalobacillus sp. CinArs1]|uniref:glutamate synthase large subunit n=1 Tax=Alkalihalobacillus sp. CinArs1 TaxID=2995314 RepID=UPI0022DDCB99|nr:glutamate synthase large subunit [Alkalihalobacillus sp. CinArs1]
MVRSNFPEKQGLYDPIHEHDACGIGLIADMNNEPAHSIIEKGIYMLRQLDHRGGQGSDPDTGDGAGIMLGIPHEFFASETDFDLPEKGAYGVGMMFLPVDNHLRQRAIKILENEIKDAGQELMGWREVPIDESTIGEAARIAQPVIRQVFIKKGNISEEAFERKLYVIRKKAEKEISRDPQLAKTKYYAASFSKDTIVYKGMLTPEQLDQFYLDLKNPNFTSSFSMVHSRFSTNTFPSWDRAHPNRYLIHNGEINTLRGNVNWMRAREGALKSNVFGDDMKEIAPIIRQNGSDSSSLDNCLEFLTLSGRSLPHAAMMMIPEPWDKDTTMQDPKKAFYEYHSCLMEPWDGPTAIAFTNGRQIGAMLDRNGLRPARYVVTDDNTFILSSEVGVIEIDEEKIIEKGRLSPGKMLMVDFEQKRLVYDEEIKEEIATEYPYRDWLTNNLMSLTSEEVDLELRNEKELVQIQRAFGFTYEELTKNIAPMVTEKKDPIGSMGNDVPLAVLSDRPQLLFNYFKQLFAQVTNPPIDSIREESVTSTMTLLGPEGNLLDTDKESCRRIRLETPILTKGKFDAVQNLHDDSMQAETLNLLFDPSRGETEMEHALLALFKKADRAIQNGKSILVLSDSGVGQDMTAIPSLLAISGLHHHLIKKETRTKVSIIIETGEARDVHQFAMLIGYGADAIYPYLAYESIAHMLSDGTIQGFSFKDAIDNYIDAATSGIVKVMSKMGISTIQSYRGAQIFEAIGISNEVIDRYFAGTASQIDGIPIDVIAKETLLRHHFAYHDSEYEDVTLETGSDMQWRRGGEHHSFNPKTIHTLQHAARSNNYELYKTFSSMAHEENLTYLRQAFDFQSNGSVPIEEVESVESITRRFKTGAMSYGALSEEAHEALAIAMNRIGGKSNSGEGGEHPSRFKADENGDLRRSAIKQVASGRFGVSSHYLTNADEIQIKMAQGAKPGEGGQLPGKKVYPWIAEVRGSTPGVGLISPPPHHDIYSIEDLAQLIHDLKNANPSARISVKLVAKAGVGTIAAGVAKGLADCILISGYEGGSGASPRTSIRHAGLPWELGLAETHQTLVLNDLRDRVVLEADGKMMTGRDVVMAALLGAEEFGFSTAPLVVLGCILMRACHLDTCPVGVATQNPELRKKFMGSPDHVVNYLTFIAEEVREIMAELGFRSIEEMIGKTNVLEVSRRTKEHWKAGFLNLEPLLYRPHMSDEVGTFHQRNQDHNLDAALDRTSIIPACLGAIEEKKSFEGTFSIHNTNRVAGAMLGHEITKRYGEEGLPEETIKLNFNGSAGQSFGAFVPNGVTMRLEGDANDYVGKGLSGGKLIIHPSKLSTFERDQNTIIGNVAFYGATSGEAYISGLAGERFCVRNSGVKAVVEGIGDNGCEYMTGGRVVVLGSTGKNFAAGMSGGVAYVLSDNKDAFLENVNPELVHMESLTNYEEILEVKKLVQEHAYNTDSPKAIRILQNWNEFVGQFVKVIPKEFKKITASLEELKEQGYKDDDAALEVFQQAKNGNVKPTKVSDLEPV